MALRNVDFLQFNKGLISPRALGRVDVDRALLTAETMTNWLPRTQGSMKIRPGTQHLGSILNDTGCQVIPFVSSTTQTEILEITSGKMRIWKNDALLATSTRKTTMVDIGADTGLWRGGGGNYIVWYKTADANIVSGTNWTKSTGASLLLSTNGGSDTGSLGDTGTIGAVVTADRKIALGDTGEVNRDTLRLRIVVGLGPVSFRVGTDTGQEDILSETILRTGYHYISFIPTDTGGVHLRFINDQPAIRSIQSVTFDDTGNVEVEAPWLDDTGGNALNDIRWAQSGDVMYLACRKYPQYQIERRNNGLSWSIVEYNATNGPFIGKTGDGVSFIASGGSVGNTTLTSDKPFFTKEHEGSLFKIYYDGYQWQFRLAGDNAFTPPIQISGVTDASSGLRNADERKWQYTTTGTWSGSLRVMRTTEDKFLGPYALSNISDSGDTNDLITNGTYTFANRDNNAINNNLIEYAKIGFGPGDYTSGIATVDISRYGNRDFGVVKVLRYVNSKSVYVEIIEALPGTSLNDTGVPAYDWEEGSWSLRQDYPTSVALYEGRLWWFGNTTAWASVSDDFDNFSTTATGDLSPIERSFGEGPVDTIDFALPLGRLIAGTAGNIWAFKSTSFDEPLTDAKMSIKSISTEGCNTLPAVSYNNNGIYVHRGGVRAFEIIFNIEIADYITRELTILNPEVLEPGVVDITVQNQPDTRIHFVLSDGTVAILSYEPDENFVAWSKYVTDTGTSSKVERALALPGEKEDRVYYVVKRTINGSEKRFLEKWPLESKTIGDTGLTWLSDCAVSFTTGTATTTITGLGHLEGEQVVCWANDSGQANNYGRDMGLDDTGGDQQFFTVSSGSITVGTAVKKAVVGLPYEADWKSTKLAYAASAGSPLTQMKRADHIGFVLADAHNSGLYFGRDFDNLDPMPKVLDEGATVDPDKIFTQFDKISMAFPGLWDEDSRICLKAKAPRPVEVLAAVLTMRTNDKI